jgi:hypothetical protein
MDIKDATLMVLNESAGHPNEAIIGPILDQIGREAPIRS